MDGLFVGRACKHGLQWIHMSASTSKQHDIQRSEGHSPVTDQHSGTLTLITDSSHRACILHAVHQWNVSTIGILSTA